MSPSPILSRFTARSTSAEVLDGIDLAGRTAIVTGASSGIGVETARALADAGAETVLAVRRPDTAEPVAAAIRAAGGRVEIRPIELGDLASVRAFAASWGERPLHILVNNAGVMATPPGQTAQGFETQFGVNHLGHFLLTLLLRGALASGASGLGCGARVVALTSGAHHLSPVHFDDPHYRARAYDPLDAYGQSKAANCLFAIGLTEAWAADGIAANAVMPGGIMTGLGRHVTPALVQRMGALGWHDPAEFPVKTPAQGAATTVWAATAPALEQIGGRYLEDCAEAPPYDPARPFHGLHPHAADPEAARRLWRLSLDLTQAR